MERASPEVRGNRWAVTRRVDQQDSCARGRQWPARSAGIAPGEAHDNRLVSKLLSRLKSESMLLADRGYDADWIRELAMKKGAWANIPPKSNRNDSICFSPSL